jgi:RNA polymerase primary sigma factor
LTFPVYIVYLYYMRKTTKITQSITNRDSQSFDKYLKDINPIGLITTEREVELANQIKEGSQRAQKELIEANLRFVVSIAKQYQGRGLDISDLVSEGNIGLIKAAQKFDVSKGIKFISYAVWWIRQSILQSLADNSRMIRLPLNQINSLNKIRECQSKLEQELSRLPDSYELAEELGINHEKIELTMKSSGFVKSLDSQITDDEGGLTLEDTISSDSKTDSEMDYQSLKLEIAQLLCRLSEKEKTVIELSFGLSGKSEMTTSEISEFLGVGTERVRQIKKLALSKLK